MPRWAVIGESKAKARPFAGAAPPAPSPSPICAGIRHVAEVNAESLFEAAFLVLRAFKASRCTERIGPATRVEVAMAARWTPMR